MPISIWFYTLGVRLVHIGLINWSSRSDAVCWVSMVWAPHAVCAPRPVLHITCSVFSCTGAHAVCYMQGQSWHMLHAVLGAGAGMSTASNIHCGWTWNGGPVCRLIRTAGWHHAPHTAHRENQRDCSNSNLRGYFNRWLYIAS